MPPKIILDCDPGLDDAFALMLAITWTELVGVTTVSGNVPVEKTTANALALLDFFGRPDVPVHSGSPAPLSGPPLRAPHIHGESGLGNSVLPKSRRCADSESAVDFIVDTTMKYGDVSLVATGPLTNIALALKKEPRISGRVPCLSLMGGSATSGNVTPAAEFNVYADPEAAALVFGSGIPLRMCGLSLTRQARVLPAAMARIGAVGTASALLGAELLRYYGAAVRKAFDADGPDLHDALAVAWIVRPDFFTAAPMRVEVELSGTFTRGMTVCDYRHLRTSDPCFEIGPAAGKTPRGSSPNAEVGLTLDFPAFLEFLLETLAMLP